MKFLATTYTSLKLLSMRGLLLGSAALFFCVMINPAAAAKPDCGLNPGHPSCKSDDSDSDSGDGTFSVDIDGPVTGASDADWLASFGGKKSIGNNEPGAGPGNIGVLDLAFFEGFFTAPDPSFDECFTGSGELNQGIIQQGKRGTAEGLFWFTGQADDAASTPVLYLLKVFGVFASGDWPPVNTDDITTLTMDNWQMGVENVGRTIKSNSCIGEGNFDADSLSIKVTRTN